MAIHYTCKVAISPSSYLIMIHPCINRRSVPFGIQFNNSLNAYFFPWKAGNYCITCLFEDSFLTFYSFSISFSLSCHPSTLMAFSLVGYDSTASFPFQILANLFVIMSHSRLKPSFIDYSCCFQLFFRCCMLVFFVLSFFCCVMILLFGLQCLSKLRPYIACKSSTFLQICITLI